MDTHRFETKLTNTIKAKYQVRLMANAEVPIGSVEYRLQTKELSSNHAGMVIEAIRRERNLGSTLLYMTRIRCKCNGVGFITEFSFFWNGQFRSPQIQERWKRRATQSKRRALYA